MHAIQTITLATLILILGHLRDGLKAYDAGDYFLALSKFSTILNNYEQNDYTDDAMYWSGQTLIKMGKPKEAEARLLELLRRFPQSEFAERADDALASLGIQRGK